jgi:hypothetical protein
MSDLSQRIDAHLIQCHREDDDSELLLVECKAEIQRLTLGLESVIDAADSFCDGDGDFVAGQVKIRAYAALNGEAAQ